jgi:hypothetical protein
LFTYWKDSVGNPFLLHKRGAKTFGRNEIWPDAKFPALGAFMFLRFISPAVVHPESIDIEVAKENESTMKKGLLVIAKVIQGLANNIFFGKQAHMSSLNEFLKAHIVTVTRFLSDLNACVISSFLLMYSDDALEIRNKRRAVRPGRVGWPPLRRYGCDCLA